VIEISLSVKSPDAPPEGASHWRVLLPPWAEVAQNAESAVNKAIEDYFDAETWDEWFGLDESDTLVIVTVHTPTAIAGTYEVRLKRTTKAFALLENRDAR
jgi:hypothetical protein